jgi:hypothetical protein
MAIPRSIVSISYSGVSVKNTDGFNQDGYISGIEVNLRNVNDRIIKLIVFEFGVNEEWLRFGKGKMFMEKKSNEKANLMLSLFNNLPSHYQDVVLGTIELLRKANETERKNKR